MNRYLFLVVLTLSLLVPAFAQQMADVEQGLKPYGTYHGGDIDSISMTNGNLTLQIPLTSYAQRGRISTDEWLSYNAKNYAYTQQCSQTETPVDGDPEPIFGHPMFCTERIVRNGGDFGPAVHTPNDATVMVSYPVVQTDGTNTTYEKLITVYSGDGSGHQLGFVGTAQSLGYGTAGSMYRSVDGTGWLFRDNEDAGPNLSGGTGTLWFPNGNQASVSYSYDEDGQGSIGVAKAVTDPDGNYIGATDTMGRTVSVTFQNPASSLCPSVNAPYQSLISSEQHTYADGQMVTYCYAGVNIHTDFIATHNQFNFEMIAPANFIQSVVISTTTAAPGDSHNLVWSFIYDSANTSLTDPTQPGYYAYGELQKIIFPTGGTLSYTWGPAGFCQVGGPDGRAYPVNNHAVLSRTLDAADGAGPHTWNYSWSLLQNGVNNSYGPTYTNIITNPLVAGDAAANESVHYVSAVAGCGLYETETDWFQGSHSSGALLKKVVKHFHAAPNGLDEGFAQTAADVFEDSETSILNGSVSNTTTTAYNATFNYGRLEVVANAGSPPVWGGSAPSVPIHVQEPSEVDEYNFDGTLLQKTTSSYAWQTDARAQQFWNANLLSTPTATLVYDGTGKLAETDYSYDEQAPTTFSGCSVLNHSAAPAAVRGHVTTTTHWLNGGTSPQYKTTWYDTGNKYQTLDATNNPTTYHYCDQDTSGAWTTSVTNALNQTTQFRYDVVKGAETSSTDPNSQVTTFFWDVLHRLTSANYPDGGLITLDYPNPNQATKTQKLDATRSIIDTAYFDGVGRAKQTVHSDPEGDDTVETTYDPMGRVASVTNPHRSTSSATDGTTSYHYDALGRTLLTTKQDGGTAQTQYSANCITVTDEAGKQRKACSDALGRLIEVDEPGSGANSPGTAGSGSINVSGSLHSSGTSGTHATGYFTVAGTEVGSQTWVCNDECVKGPFVWDSGPIWVTVNGCTGSTTYGRFSTAAGLASALASAINSACSAYVSASYPGSGTTVYLTAIPAGPNYSLTGSASTNDPTDFGGASFEPSFSGASLTGGVNPVTTYDSGTVTATVNGFTSSASYNQSLNNTAALVATTLTNGLNASGSPVTASLSGTTISMTAKTVGSATNWAISGSSTASFTASSGTLAGGASPGGMYAPASTLYSYDGNSNLLCVEQHGGVSGTGCSSPSSSDATSAWRVRRFNYDSLSRLLSATNPESGTTSYTYTADGDVLTKTDARGIQALMTYDALHRLTYKTYPGHPETPSPAYTYDTATNWGVTSANPIGRLTLEQNGSGATWNIFSYDTMGRVLTQWSTKFPANNGSNVTTAAYNLAGDMTSLTYPSGRKVTNGFDNAGRLNNVTFDSFSGTTVNYPYWTANDINPSGNVYLATLGSGALEYNEVNSRLQPCQFAVKMGSTWLTDRRPRYGNATSDCANSSVTGNNGNVMSVVDNVSSGKTQTYTYDYLNRITSATTNVTTGPDAWSQTFSYDAWGNMNQSGSLIFSQAFAYNNRLNSSAYTYDAAGGLTYDSTHSYAYDAESQIASVDAGGSNPTTYTYDANGNRVRKSTGSNYTEYVYFGGEPIAEKDQSGAWTDYIFAGGKRIAMATGTASTGTSYFHSDTLGSQRLMTDSSGVAVSGTDRTYLPFGWEWNTTTAGSHYKFTGKERDSETGNDYFGARYYNASMGRWLSPDWSMSPSPVPYADLTDPQTLNLYGYVRNRPTFSVDADGHGTWDFLVGETQGIASLGSSIVQGGAINLIALSTGQFGFIGKEIRSGAASVADSSFKLSDAVNHPGIILDAYTELGDKAAGNALGDAGGKTALYLAPGALAKPAAAEEGVIYELPPQQGSGKPYIGSADDLGERMATRTDGRTGPAEKVDTYRRGDLDHRHFKEQKQMNLRGGIRNLDNKRNAASAKRMKRLEAQFGDRKKSD